MTCITNKLRLLLIFTMNHLYTHQNFGNSLAEAVKQFQQCKMILRSLMIHRQRWYTPNVFMWPIIQRRTRRCRYLPIIHLPCAALFDESSYDPTFSLADNSRLSRSGCHSVGHAFSGYYYFQHRDWRIVWEKKRHAHLHLGYAPFDNGFSRRLRSYTGRSG